MRKPTHSNSNLINRQPTKKWKSTFELDDAPGKPIDLTNGANDDGWDDCLDDLDKPSTAVERILHLSAQRIATKSKVKAKVPKNLRGPRTRKPTKAKTVKIIEAAPAIGPNNAPEPNDMAARRLWRCNNLDEVRAEHALWHERYKDKCLKAIEKRNLPDEMRAIISAILDGTATDSPLLTTNKVLALAYESTFRAIWAATKDDLNIEFALVTIIAGSGGTSLNSPVLQTLRAEDRYRKVLSSMSKDFIGVREWSMFNSHRHPDGGRHVQGHEHVLVWAPGVVAHAQEVAERRMKDFSPNITGAPQINVRRVEMNEVNIARVCAYLFKSPHKAMNWNPPRDGKPGHMNQSEKGDRSIRYLRMAQIRSLMTLEDVMFAGGQGIDIRSDVIKLVRQTCHSDVPMPNRLLHPNELGRFWTDVNHALKRPDWRLPVIAYQP